MAQRVTHRSRSRISDWFGRAGTPVSPADAYENGSADWHAIGPFTRHQLFELLFRVKEIGFSASIGWEDSATPTHNTGTYTIDAAAPRIDYILGGFSELLVNESRMFEYAFSTSLFRSVVTTTGSFQLSLVSPIADTFDIPIAIDTDGNYWLTQALFSADPPELAGFQTLNNTKLDPSEPSFTADLTLSNSTVTMTLRGLTPYSYTSITPSGSMAATEWHPYATKAGTAAWSTTTGLAVNGGPGA